MTHLQTVRNDTKMHTLAKLKRRQQKAISAVLSSKTVDEGLQKAKVSRRAWYSWLSSDPAFKSAYDTARAELLDDALHSLRSHLTSAIDTLAALLKTKAAKPPTRLRAATEIISIIMKADRDSDLVRRIEELERRAPKGARNNHT